MLYKKTIETEFRTCQSITDEVNEIVTQSGVQDGLCIVSLPHTTAGLVITSFWDKRGLDDLMDEIDRNIPTRVTYKHQDSPYDASGHVKSTIFGTSLALIVKDGKLILGSSQGLVFVEFDGPRPREFYVKMLSTSK
ncbi:secondary thiamine-phosphate synthase enzyme YjbQ [Bacillus sp. JJ1562]|uniref:secondary thiamine-phosphate synthase enzyme YjbQ n=1 Tax=Bacillus sp. JJ1562 TaxID=3122960 RepID=UPI0030023698